MNDRHDGSADRSPSAGPALARAATSEHLPPDAPVVDASTLFGRHRQVVIGHNGCRYVLRITRHGKLILNK
ncbi:MAG TPA: hemin uptake protein HemP [Methyloceanibacter sp.]|jgi:hemin uptake protein HemP